MSDPSDHKYDKSEYVNLPPRPCAQCDELGFKISDLNHEIGRLKNRLEATEKELYDSLDAVTGAPQAKSASRY